MVWCGWTCLFIYVYSMHIACAPVAYVCQRGHSGQIISLRPCTLAGHAGRLVKGRIKERRRHTRPLQSAGCSAAVGPPCSSEPLNPPTITKPIRKIGEFERKIYTLTFIPSSGFLLCLTSPPIPLPVLSVNQTPAPPAGS